MGPLTLWLGLENQLPDSPGCAGSLDQALAGPDPHLRVSIRQHPEDLGETEARKLPAARRLDSPPRTPVVPMSAPVGGAFGL